MREQNGTKCTVSVLGGRHVWRRVCPAAAMLCLLAFASLVRAQQLRSPVRIAEGPPGQLVVSDSRQGAVFGIDKATLEVVWSHSVEGEPLAVGYWNDLVLVGNQTAHNVEVYALRDNKLKLLYNLGGAKKGQPGFIQKPMDMAFEAREQRVFVVDGGEKSVKVYDIQGYFLYSLPQPGSAQLLNPTCIALDENRQEVLVSDYGDLSASSEPARVLIYSYGGEYLGQISGNSSDSAAFFSKPQGLTVDGQGHIFLAEAFLGKILVFDRNTGALVETFGSFGDDPGQLKLPLDLVLDDVTGDVFVTNNTPGRIEAFRGAGRIP